MQCIILYFKFEEYLGNYYYLILMPNHFLLISKLCVDGHMQYQKGLGAILSKNLGFRI